MYEWLKIALLRMITTWESFWTEQPLWCWGWGCNDTPNPEGVALLHRTAQWCCVLLFCCCLGSDSWCDPPGCPAWTETDILHFNPTFIGLFTLKQSLNSWSIRNTYTIHDTPPIKTLTSLGCPVLSLRPLMVRDEPPALGPLWGKMLLSTGSWRRRERGEEER